MDVFLICTRLAHRADNLPCCDRITHGDVTRVRVQNLVRKAVGIRYRYRAVSALPRICYNAVHRRPQYRMQQVNPSLPVRTDIVVKIACPMKLFAAIFERPPTISAGLVRLEVLKEPLGLSIFIGGKIRRMTSFHDISYLQLSALRR